VSKIEIYRQELQKVSDWEPYLLANSGLPGPRGNLELAHAVFEEGNNDIFERFLRFTPDKAPVNAPEEFLHFCGVFGQGKYLSKTADIIWDRLSVYAGDPRWRTREAVAMALQAYGDRDIGDLIEKMEIWAKGNHFQQRAAAAGLCEPRLLKRSENAERVLGIMDTITRSLISSFDRKEESFKVLRQALGYCWSVAVAAIPTHGKIIMEKWFICPDKDIRYIMKDNLSKNRLVKLDAAWVERWKQEI
jgi:hypothetical protein